MLSNYSCVHYIVCPHIWLSRVQVRTFKHATRPSKVNMDLGSDLDEDEEDDGDMLGSNGLPSSHCRAAERRLEVCTTCSHVGQRVDQFLLSRFTMRSCLGTCPPCRGGSKCTS